MSSLSKESKAQLKQNVTIYYTVCPKCSKTLSSLFLHQLKQFISGHCMAHKNSITLNDFKIYEKKVSLKCES